MQARKSTVCSNNNSKEVTTQVDQKIKTPCESIGYENPISRICLNFKQKHLFFGIFEQL